MFFFVIFLFVGSQLADVDLDEASAQRHSQFPGKCIGYLLFMPFCRWGWFFDSDGCPLAPSGAPFLVGAGLVLIALFVAFTLPERIAKAAPERPPTPPPEVATAPLTAVVEDPEAAPPGAISAKAEAAC
jgi:hypothetical protein